MQFKDRTNEFRSCVESAAMRVTGNGSDVRRPLLKNGSRDDKKGQRSEFARMAAKIGKDIQGTTFKLEKLAQCKSTLESSLAKRKTLFDDRPVEISELTFIIKQDIAALNQQILQLQQFTKNTLNAAGTSKQISEHNNNVVMMLQSKLADTSIGFKDVLEIRTQNMKASRDRTEQFMYTGNNALAGPASVLRSRNPHGGNGAAEPDLRSDSPLYRQPTPSGKGKGRDLGPSNAPGGGQADFLALDFGNSQTGTGMPEQGFMQQELALQQGDEQYMNQRSTAIETIESTVAELGQIFSQLATMVAIQGEVVTRIDADTEEIATNVSGAQSELLKYYASVSSNRWLMLKVSGAGAGAAVVWPS
ncbi:BZ3500_MvSof-1268-A1-R1_Chr1-1g01172 [Microbotryum saponariae]|uniref:BZ3500_MvSof-1268-A1-R1_Chr1-1g01172 protein n=1 Tax=Microbotryum saponariae TaxID=289078 RepID=A0A2X0KAX3_9BASI|nr:BZ3500_MvSof-1268-A1-R1_Chr1-1g01172 [Microbotryum saponariae]SCZ93569.1 BZ3501_MvSof-1269-A2-R1_Chr1-1g00768 [Microbotryum saponariae]